MYLPGIERDRKLTPLISPIWDHVVDTSTIVREDEEAGLSPLDLIETHESFIVKTNVPGFKKEDIKILVSNGTLSIKGKNPEIEQEVEGIVYRNERYKGDIHRVISFHVPVNFDKLEAKLEDGVLIMSIPKDHAKPEKELQIS